MHLETATIIRCDTDHFHAHRAIGCVPERENFPDCSEEYFLQILCLRRRPINHTFVAEKSRAPNPLKFYIVLLPIDAVSVNFYSRDVRILKFWVRVSPQISTKDLRPCPQYYAILGPHSAVSQPASANNITKNIC